MPLIVTIPDQDFWDEYKCEFVFVKGKTLKLEHSLVSISKWESKWNKAFLTKEEKTDEQMIDYIRCMTLTKDVDVDLYNYIPIDVMQQIKKYIEAPMTATWFNDEQSNGGKSKGNRETVTSELIYYWMIALNIPFECQRWHLNRLLTLIQVCNIKNTPPKKMSKREIFNRNRALNEARKRSLHTNG